MNLINKENKMILNTAEQLRTITEKSKKKKLRKFFIRTNKEIRRQAKDGETSVNIAIWHYFPILSEEERKKIIQYYSSRKYSLTWDGEDYIIISWGEVTDDLGIFSI
jgi:hypothetical protein